MLLLKTMAYLQHEKSRLGLQDRVNNYPLIIFFPLWDSLLRTFLFISSVSRYMIYKTTISNVLTLLVVYITGGARSRSSIFKYKSLMPLLKSIKRVILPIICLNLFLSTEDGLKEIYKQNHNYLLFLTTDFCSSRKLYKLSGHSHMAIIKFDKNVDRIRHYTAKKDNIFRLRFYSPLGTEVVGDNALI